MPSSFLASRLAFSLFLSTLPLMLSSKSVENSNLSSSDFVLNILNPKSMSEILLSLKDSYSSFRASIFSLFLRSEAVSNFLEGSL